MIKKGRRTDPEHDPGFPHKIMEKMDLNKTLEEMSEKDLMLARKQLNDQLKQINEQLENLQKQKEEESRRKAEYHLAQAEPKYNEDFHRMWSFVEEVVAGGGTVNAGNIEEIHKKGLIKLPTTNEEVYPCPKCGRLSLFVGDFGAADTLGEYRKRKVCCENCDFEPDVKYETNYSDAWDSFHNWLIKNGYLEEVGK